jgi:hypothetical protein
MFDPAAPPSEADAKTTTPGGAANPTNVEDLFERASLGFDDLGLGSMRARVGEMYRSETSASDLEGMVWRASESSAGSRQTSHPTT